MAGTKKGGFGRHRAPAGVGANLRGTLGTLFRTTMVQVESLRDVVERGARDQKEWIDHALLGRRRKEALAALGEALYDAVRDGATSLDDIDSLDNLLADVAEIDEALNDGGATPGAGLAGAAAWVNQFAGQRFDDRDDGTVSSSSARPRSSPRDPIPVWRPTIPPDHPGDDQEFGDGDSSGHHAAAAGEPDLVSANAAPPRRERGPRGPRQRQGGGIQFGGPAPAADEAETSTRTLADLVADDDDDLSAYMHEDDVPGPKGE